MNLDRDIKKLEKYQSESLIGQLSVVQLHLEDIYSGKELAFCIGCLRDKHLPAIEVLGQECLGICRSDPVWNEVSQWAKDFRENKLNNEHLGKDNPRTLELKNQARDFRHKFAEIAESAREEKEVKRHLT